MTGSDGLWGRFARPDRTLDVTAWRRALGSGEAVGTCRRCGGFLCAEDAGRMVDGSPLAWFVARCVSCDAEFVSPGGRLGRSKHSASRKG